MTTEKLYYIDSHMYDFEAKVLDCRAEKGGWIIILDRTAFFPEGGGQLADTGRIGAAHVGDVQERGGEILHFTSAPLSPGESCSCHVDGGVRFRRMQTHSGEHIVSGLIHGAFGYDNVGFHMGERETTIDFNGELDWESVMEIERRANELVQADVPLRAWLPEPEELKRLEYRSKLDLTENVRIVEIGDVDRYACCAPHVSRTGEIGVIKILDCQRHRGGVRMNIICGMDAVELFRDQQARVTAVSRALSAERGKIDAAVDRLLDENARLKEKADALSMELVRLKAGSIPETEGNICVFDSGLDEIARRELTNLLTDKCGVFAAVFCGSDGEGWRYIIGSRSLDLRRAAGQINAAINGRGGGTAQMIQGRAAADRESIAAALERMNLTGD